MKFINLTALVVCIFTNQVMATAIDGLVARQTRHVTFNVAVAGVCK